MNHVILEGTVDSVVAEQAMTYADRTAVICGGQALSYRTLDADAQDFGSWMTTRGIEPGDHVAVWLPNGLSWVVAQVAVAKAGAAVVPVSTRLVAAEVEFILRHAGCKLLVVFSTFLGRDFAGEATEIARRLDGAVEVLVLDSDGAQFPSTDGAVELPGSTSGGPAVVQYTSGTTGRPKGCVLSHRTWTNNARLSAGLAGINADDVVFSPSPFFHLFGSLTALMGCLSVGACLVTTPTFEASSAAEAIITNRASHMVAVPTVWLDLMAPEYSSSLDVLIGGRWGGGAFPRRALEHAMSADGFGLALNAIYGMTEAPTLTQVRPQDSLRSRLETVGRPTPGVDLRVLDPGSDREVAPGLVGEIAIRGYCRALGYLHDRDAMDSRMTEGGLFRTGDLGTLDDDGYLRVTGRLTDMVVSGGANIYAREVEDVLLEVDAVTLAAVVARPDSRLGEVPVAWLALGGQIPQDAEGVILAHCRSRLASYKVPRDIHILSELPLTESGKIHKTRLSEMTEQAYREAPS